MKAVEFDGKPFSMKVKTLPIPKITQPTDAVIRVTSSGICGTDLHTFHGRFPVKPPMTMGHEIVGVVHAIGSKVHDLKIGDRVIVSAVVFEDGLEGVDPVIGGLGVGTLPGLQQFNGGQANFVRVPFASENLLLLPTGKQHELDYVLLADIFPTANWALDCSGFVFGDVVVVFGAGPVGLLCAYSAFLRGASKVYSVDRVPQRLAKAKNIGAIPIDFSKGDPVAQIMKYEPEGVDRACDCIGYECVNAEGVNEGNLVLTQAINVVRAGGGIGVIGVYIPEDAGIVQLRQYQPALKRLIESGRAKPSFIFDRELRIEDAAEAYKEFSDHDFIKSVIRLDGGENGSLIDNEKVEEKSSAQKKRTRNGAHA
ncbi:putative S-glutathione dehydrogenase, partial [Hyaloscypha bicolor E]